MIKKIIFFLLILTLANCGYQPIYLKSNIDLLVNKFELNGDKNINRKVISLLNLKKNSEDKPGFILELNSEKKIETVAKDKAGKASIYKTTITVKVRLNQKEKLIKEKNFVESFVYNNSDNKFDLLQYQKNIEINLTDKISEKIMIFLNT